MHRALALFGSGAQGYGIVVGLVVDHGGFDLRERLVVNRQGRVCRRRTPGHPFEHLLIQRAGRRFLAPLRRDLRLLVLVFGFAGDTSGLADLLPDDRDNGVVGDSPLAGTVVVQNVTKPKLALLHQTSRRGVWLERRDGRRRKSLAEP
jgi:hypothetical protein